MEVLLMRAMMIMILISFAPSFACGAAFTPALLENVQAEGESRSMTGVPGTCEEISHIAVGPVGSDLSHNQMPFRCDSAVLIFFDNQHRHVMVNFALQSATQTILAFAGTMEPDGVIMHVSRLYFQPGKPTFADDGACKFFFASRHMTSMFCGGKIDADGRRTVASIAFKASPGQ